MSEYIELEIQNVLNELHSLDDAADRLIHNLESSDNLNFENVSALANFLLNAGAYDKLLHFCIKLLANENNPIPWPYFIEALRTVLPNKEVRFVDALLEGLEETNSQQEASRAPATSAYLSEAHRWKEERKYKLQKDYESNRRTLLEQLTMFRTQQLYEQEKKLLVQLQGLYPGDAEVAREVREHKQRYALEILQKRAPKKLSVKTDDLQLKDPEVEKTLDIVMQALEEKAQEMPEMAFDFAVAAFMFERYSDTLALLQHIDEDTTSSIWLKLEALLQSRRFVELLNLLAQVEVLLAHEAETFFATAYLRAQALWGLGQKHTAIEVLEGLIAARPHYRAASALLSVWSQQ